MNRGTLSSASTSKVTGPANSSSEQTTFALEQERRLVEAAGVEFEIGGFSNLLMVRDF